MSLSGFFLRDDAEFDRVVERHRAQTPAAILFYLAMHLVPGVLAYIGIFHLREPLMALGLSNRWAQFAVLASMALGWHLGVPVLALRLHDRMSWREVAVFLGLHRLDVRGLLTVVPVITVLFTLLTAPYMAWVHPALYAWLNRIPAIAIPEWHIFEIGYYEFPLPVLVVVFIANFLGEELYFRGYLMQKINKLKVGRLDVDWAANSLLFQLYHVWQAPMNWAFAPMFLLIPLGLLVKLRKSLYGAIVFHLFVNLAWGAVLWKLFGIE